MIYLDNAATTKICDSSLELINKFYSQQYFNPSAVYSGAITVKKAIEDARKQVAMSIYADSEKIFFTSGGTESDNLAVFGTCSNKSIGKIICGQCEHSAVYNCLLDLKQKGFDVEFIPCNADGTINLDSFKAVIENNSVGFASIMHVNNVTGGVNDIAYLSKLLKDSNKNAIFHSDGVQALGKLDFNIKSTDVDLYSMSSHKINGPKGVGAIYVKFPNKLKSFALGGGQERGLRSGTENTAGIIAFGEACKLWKTERTEIITRFKTFQETIISNLEPLDGVKINTDIEISSPHIMSISIDGIRGEILLHLLESEGIFIGRGSACSTKDSTPRALKAMKVTSSGTIRISFGMFNTINEINEFCKCIVQLISSLRSKIRIK